MNHNNQRPQSVTWLAVFVLSFTGWHWLQFAVSLKRWNLLIELPMSVSPLYITLTGFLWGLLGLHLAWGLFSGKNWASRATLLSSLGFSVYVWLDRLLLRKSELANMNWPFVLSLTVLLLIGVFWILSRPSALAFFGDHDE